jgi:hypothetical protein
MATQQEERLKQFRAVQDQGFALFNKKNTDYGDAFADFGVIGIIVRVSDKMRRFVSVSNNGISFVNDEGLRDTLIDMHNYSAMAIMLLDEAQKIGPGETITTKKLVQSQYTDEELGIIQE